MKLHKATGKLMSYFREHHSSTVLSPYIPGIIGVYDTTGIKKNTGEKLFKTCKVKMLCHDNREKNYYISGINVGTTQWECRMMIFSPWQNKINEKRFLLLKTKNTNIMPGLRCVVYVIQHLMDLDKKLSLYVGSNNND